MTEYAYKVHEELTEDGELIKVHLLRIEIGRRTETTLFFNRPHPLLSWVYSAKIADSAFTPKEALDQYKTQLVRKRQKLQDKIDSCDQRIVAVNSCRAGCISFFRSTMCFLSLQLEGRGK